MATNVLTDSTKEAYAKKIEINFINGSDKTEINPNKINYITIEHMYESRAMPIIYLSMSIETSLYSDLLAYKESAKIHLRIQTYDKYLDTPLYVDYINGQFVYYLSTENPNYSEELSTANENDDSNYRDILMGLMDMNIMNSMKATFDGIRKNINQHTLIYSAIQDTKIIMKIPPYNETYDTFIIPPLSSRKQMLDYIFTKDPFYDTYYIYFMDYEYSYLLDRSGDVISSGDGTKDTIIMEVATVIQDEAYIEGMYTLESCYYFYINNKDININKDNNTDSITNQIVAVTDSGYDTVDLDLTTRNGSATKQTFQRYDHSNGMPVVIKNTLESSQITVNVIKQNIDTSIITPNKAFIIKCDTDSDYDGQYILMYKKEIINGRVDNYVSTITLGLRKLSDVQNSTKAMKNLVNKTDRKTITSTSAANSGLSSKTATSSASTKATSTSSSI